MILRKVGIATRQLLWITRCDTSFSFLIQKGTISRRCLSSASPFQKPYYVTTPIFYVNAAPHVGHLYTLVLTDILKRWQVLQGREAILCTGTDEHGMKIQRAAAQADQDVGAFCNQNAQIFDLLAQRVHVARDHFIRTTEPGHRFAVQHFWLMLKDRGHVYTKKHEGWYSVSDESFYPQSGVQLALDRSTGRKFMASIETGKEVEWYSEINYHFRLSTFRDRLLRFYDENPNFIVPQSRMKEMVQAVEKGLSDLSISRPVERLTWGIPVPDDSSQTIYVWLDALINYLTKANYPFQIPGQEAAAGWPADVHVIGKDIIRFHCIYWPAFLMALDIPPPKQILTHAHWTLGRQKMAKSTGNVVNPFFALDRFGVDVMRYYMAHDGGIKNDADYENSLITERYRKGLYGGLGNLASRVTRGKGWNVRRAVQRSTSGACDQAADALSTTHRQRLLELPDQVARRFEDLDSGAALRDIMDVVYETNSYMQAAAPWDLAKQTPPPLDTLDATIYLCAETLRIAGILLQPFMPGKMKMLLDQLGVQPERRFFKDAVLGGDADYGNPLPGVNVGKGLEGVLFPPLTTEF